MIQPMKLLRSLRRLEQELQEVASSAEGESRLVLRNIGFISAGITVLAIGVVVGREVRQRYKFSRRTPYDMYAHSGDRGHDVECSVGI